MKKKYLLLFIAITILGLLFFYTKAKWRKTAETSKNTTETVVNMPNDFLEFYNKFHEDSLFQISHISFPLKGMKVIEEIGGGEAYQYTQEEWIIHKPFDDMGETFSRSFEEFGGIVAETIVANGGQFRSVRRFAKLSGEWNLIYYQPMGLY